MDKDIIAFDPGKTTGVAHLHLTDDDFKLVGVWQMGDPDNVWEDLLNLLRQIDRDSEDLTVLCESFEIRPDVAEPD